MAKKLDEGQLIVAILGAIGALGYVIATPKSGPGFTEFYILGLGGKAEKYPSEWKGEASLRATP